MIPAFNEARRLPDYLKRCRAYLGEQFGDRYEIFVVDDGSRDETSRVAERLLGPGGVIRLERNQGKGAAVREGMLRAKGEWVLFADADGATPIEEEKRLRAALDRGADIAIGSRAKEGENHVVIFSPRSKSSAESETGSFTRTVLVHRVLIGRIFARLVNGLLSLDVRDTQCGFKMFRRNTVEPVFSELATRRFAFDVEILVRARELGYRVVEVGVRWNEKPGSKVNVFTDSFRMLIEILAIRRAKLARAKATALALEIGKDDDTRAAS